MRFVKSWKMSTFSVTSKSFLPFGPPFQKFVGTKISSFTSVLSSTSGQKRENCDISSAANIQKVPKTIGFKQHYPQVAKVRNNFCHRLKNSIPLVALRATRLLIRSKLGKSQLFSVASKSFLEVAHHLIEVSVPKYLILKYSSFHLSSKTSLRLI